MACTDDAWGDLLTSAGAHDVYHLAAYHAVAESVGAGQAVLCVVGDGRSWIALPLLLRPIESAPGRTDVTSVYGYAGPITSARAASGELIERFQQALRDGLVARGVVSLFTRLHPLLEQAPILAGLGETRQLGSTVSIDLGRSQAEQLAAYRTNHRRDLGRLEKAGYLTEMMDDLGDLHRFVELYHQTMQRVGAKPAYLFTTGYFERLSAALGPMLRLALCRYRGEVVAGALFMRHGSTVQYHLGAVDERHLAVAPVKQVVDAARRHYHAAQAACLHLGGGRGGSEDSLFHFKAGFSDRRHAFRIWRWIIDADAYAALTGPDGATEFFPAYRA